MDHSATNKEIDEPAWIKAYMDVAGVTESQARDVFMFLAYGDVVNIKVGYVPEGGGASLEQSLR